MKNEWKIKNRWFNCVIYSEDERSKKILQNIINSFQQVTWITHNRDIQINENGEEVIAKEHIHILFKIGENARSVKSVAKDIGIEPNYLEGTRKIPFLRYLIHLDNPEKTQYSIDEVYGELKEELQKQIKKNFDDEIKITDITTQILNGNITTISDLMIYAINNHVTEQARKYFFILNKMIGERNYECKRLPKGNRVRKL